MRMESAAIALATRLRRRLAERLVLARGTDGLWRGRLADSALATAVAALALARAGDDADSARIARAVRWLTTHANPDGGWGDCPAAPSNLSATLLVRCALEPIAPHPAAIASADRWIARRFGFAPSSDALADAILRAYGDDRTFSTPILAVCAATGQLGGSVPAEQWARVPPLPFELGVLPHRLLARLGVPVVSYALPALIALGWARHRRTSAARPARLARLRERFAPAALRRLARLQPTTGGFLEAVPLTAFVVIALAEGGARDHPVVPRALTFLRELQRAHGAWPIDRDLALWLSHQSAALLAAADARGELWPASERAVVLARTLDSQWARPHPFTGAAPGGWAWTDHDGGVPDADDTSAALLALHALAPHDPRVLRAAEAGVRWLLDLQNSDGGLPTFCRGWSRLPFDRSCPDITAHALRALSAWADHLPPKLRPRIKNANARATRFLITTQGDDGTWQPLWFGHPLAADAANRTLGTAMTLTALASFEHSNVGREARNRALRWLLDAQHPAGGWGPAVGIEPSVEETAWALTALATCAETPWRAIQRALEWLDERWSADAPPPPAPIGLYFARLWYTEELYPLIFSLRAAVALARRLGCAEAAPPRCVA